MNIPGVRYLLVLAATLTLAACGGESNSSASQRNNPPQIQGSPITELMSGTQYSFQPLAADPDGDPLTFSASNLPGWASINEQSGLVSGRPTEADVGMSEPITISVTDSHAEADLPVFQIRVNSSGLPPPAEVDVPPTITGTPAITAAVGQSYSFTPVANDENDDTLVFSIANKPAWATFSTSSGQLIGTPGAGDVGTTNGIVISVSDGTTSASLSAFNLQVVQTAPANRPPVISGSPGTTAMVGTAYVFRPTASDPDGNALRFSIQGTPRWATFSATTGRLSGTPASGDVGTSATVTISVTDNVATVSLPSFTIQVPNRAPTISGSPAGSVNVGAAYAFQPTASDPDGNALTFSIANKPGWATFSTSTGRLSGTPAAGNVGSTTGIVISVSDGTASASLPSFTLQVNTQPNRAPTISGTPATSVNVGSPYSFQPTASDPDGNPMTFNITNKPGWAAFSTSTGRLSGTPAAGDVGSTTGIVITVNDGTLNASLPAFALAVVQVSTGSASLSWDAPTTNTDGSALTLSGYRLVYGQSATSMNQTVPITNPGLTSYTVSNLASGTWYFAIYAVSSTGAESVASNTANKPVN